MSFWGPHSYYYFLKLEFLYQFHHEKLATISQGVKVENFAFSEQILLLNLLQMSSTHLKKYLIFLLLKSKPGPMLSNKAPIDDYKSFHPEANHEWKNQFSFQIEILSKTYLSKCLKESVTLKILWFDIFSKDSTNKTKHSLVSNYSKIRECLEPWGCTDETEGPRSNARFRIIFTPEIWGWFASRNSTHKTNLTYLKGSY